MVKVKTARIEGDVIYVPLNVLELTLLERELDMLMESPVITIDKWQEYRALRLKLKAYRDDLLRSAGPGSAL